MKRLLGVFALLFLVGCTTIETAPLLYSANADRIRTREAIIAGFSGANYRIVSDTEFTIVIERYQTPGEMLLGNRPNTLYQFAITGDNPTQIYPRIIARFGAPSNPLQADATNRADMRAELNAIMAPIVSGLSGGYAAASLSEQSRSASISTSPSRTYYLGPRGGCYYLTGGGAKVYVDRSMCR